MRPVRGGVLVSWIVGHYDFVQRGHFFFRGGLIDWLAAWLERTTQFAGGGFVLLFFFFVFFSKEGQVSK